MSFAATFKALSDPVRRDILVMLRNGKMTAGDIAKEFELTGATVSYHLSQLKKADLLYETKVKNFIYAIHLLPDSNTTTHLDFVPVPEYFVNSSTLYFLTTTASTVLTVANILAILRTKTATNKNILSLQDSLGFQVLLA